MSGAGAAQPREAVLVRHAETEWTLSGQHTGRTDIPLTERGREAAARLAERLRGWDFELVLLSPSLRARETCELCGLSDRAQLREDLLEWDYGEYEGLTTAQIQAQRPGWDLWRDGCPRGESAQQVGARAERIVQELRAVAQQAAVFSHGHLLRVLGSRWIDLAPQEGARLGLSTGAICVLGYEREIPILTRWNDTGAS